MNKVCDFNNFLPFVNDFGFFSKNARVKKRRLKTYQTFLPACNLLASVRKYAADTLRTLYSPVTGSNTRFF